MPAILFPSSADAPAILQTLDERRHLEAGEVFVDGQLYHLGDFIIERTPQEPQEPRRSRDDQALVGVIAPPLVQHSRELAGELLRLDILWGCQRLHAGTTMRAGLPADPRRRHRADRLPALRVRRQITHVSPAVSV